ncbi:PREDICTED: uncharacterized protein LOC105566910 [Vollenhovia emeryi]|uniref:uncharacterized protein LOC105566910 n=1 Tax=Vollenhovia emeryi TaxID=411798 RepID=UPI0005F50CEE|nr:PREDICTED: uncharacterized protein LOC105566910 [Vollenhovia emeryi]
MSRRKQAKPRSLKRDEEWDDGNEQNVLEAAEQDNETTAIKQDDEEEEEEEELQRAFSRQSEDYLQDGRSTSVQGPDLENQNSLDSGILSCDKKGLLPLALEIARFDWQKIRKVDKVLKWHGRFETEGFKETLQETLNYGVRTMSRTEVVSASTSKG